MNEGMFWLFELSIFIVCYGAIAGGFLCFLKAHFRSTKIKRGLFVFFLFTGSIAMEILCERGNWPDSLCRLIGYLLIFGLVILTFRGAWEKKLLATAILITAEKLITVFSVSFLTILLLMIRHGILKQSEILELWQALLLAVPSYLAAAVILCFLSRKSCGLFEEKTGKWYWLSAGPLLLMILVIDAYNWSVEKGFIFWNGDRTELYKNQLFSHGAVCILTFLGMLAAGFYIRGMDKVYKEWQKKEQYRLQVVYLEGLKERNERMDKIRHDMKNHIISLQGLLADGNMEKMKEYLDRIAETGGIKGGEEVTGNKAVDALLYEKRKRAERMNVDWQCDMQPWKESVLNEFDFCVLAGNALDNAIEACEKTEERDRKTEKRDTKTEGTGKKTNGFLHIQTGWVKNYFLFEVKNSAGIKAGEEERRLSDSGETDRKHYGIGLLNIKETVEKYNGILNTELKDGVFILSVLIPAEQRE